MRAFNTISSLSSVALAFGALVLVGCGAAPQSEGGIATTQDKLSDCLSVPAAIQVPAGNALDFELNATGTQNYQCESTASGPAWVFIAPEANLVDDEGDLKATHFAGPTWKSVDGSSVVGAKVAAVSNGPTAIPELLLKAVSHAGEGKMAEVTYIQRLNTAGGLAPSTGCDASHIGATAKTPYTAQYAFYKASSETTCQ